MRLDLSPTAKDARSVALAALLAGGTVTIYGGTPPAAGGAETTVLLVYDLLSPAGAVTDGVFVAAIPPVAVGQSAANATWGRVKDGAGAWVIDGDAGIVGEDVLFVLESVAVTVGASIALLSFTLTEP